MQLPWKTAVRHLGRWGDTDIFPFPPENRVFFDAEDEVVELLEQSPQRIRDELQDNPPLVERALTPVGYTGYRWATQIDPYWNARYLAVSLRAAKKLEEKRLPADVVTSHRYSPSTATRHLFRADAYDSFLSSSKAKAGESALVVTADISDFYQRIYHHRLENSLSWLGIRTSDQDQIMRLVTSFTESGASYGIPIGGPASRILSEVLLHSVDSYLNSQGIPFVRYADDYRMFAESRSDAFRMLATLSEFLLRNEGLSLQKSKTRVMSSSEFLGTLELVNTFDHVDQTEEVIRARELLSFSLRFDPYSPDPDGDYERLKAAVDGLDIASLFYAELRRPRIDSRLTKQLLRAVEFADPDVKSDIVLSLSDNFDLLAPVLPQVMNALQRIAGELPPETEEQLVGRLGQLIDAGSHLLRPGVTLGYLVRYLAKSDLLQARQILVSLFDQGRTPNFVQRDIVYAMANWDDRPWLADLKNRYSNQHEWVKRAILLCSFKLRDEGRHWRDKLTLTPFDRLLKEWVASKQGGGSGPWSPPL